MGLHPDMKRWLKKSFPECFTADIPLAARGRGLVQVCDAMWILYKFAGDEDATFDSLVDHMWQSAADFYERGGHTLVECFDAAAHVPSAKREEQKKRKRGTEGVAVRTVNGLPRPWRAGLADAAVREGLMRALCSALHARFEAAKYPSTTLIAHVDGRPVRCHVDARGRVTREEMPALNLGEADVAVAHWVRQYPRRTVAVRVLDSDHIPIALLTANATARSAPFFVWLRGRGDASPGALCDEPRDVMCVHSMLERLPCPPSDFCLFLACQQTDFVAKVVRSLNAEKTMQRILAAYERGDVKGPFTECTFETQTCNLAGVLRFLRTLAAASKRATLIENPERELRRAWWNVQYWTLPKPPPCEEFGWPS